jgi:hypothetical protein
MMAGNFPKDNKLSQESVIAQSTHDSESGTDSGEIITAPALRI